MAKAIVYGLMTVKMGAVAGDGGPGASNTLTAIGFTEEDSFDLTQDDPQITEFFAEETDDPILQTIKQGKRGFTLNVMDTDADALARVLGGTVTAGPPKVWNAPSTYFNLVQTVEIVTQSGHKILFPRVQINAKIAGKVSKKETLKLTISGTVLTPTKANTPAMSVTEPA